MAQLTPMEDKNISVGAFIRTNLPKKMTEVEIPGHEITFLKVLSVVKI
jgi:hypothetical protein